MVPTGPERGALTNVNRGRSVLTTSFRAPFGSSSFGAEISTPGIGPAIVELNGLELFFVSQPASASTSGTAHTNTYLCIFNSTAGVDETYGRAQFSSAY